MRFKDAFEHVENYVIETRRELHRLAEPSDQEKNTFAFIIEEIRKLGFSYEIVEEFTVVAKLQTGRNGKTVALRADIDGLPVKENKHNLKRERTCISNRPDASHMCGHDAHVAMLLASMKVLKEIQDELVGTYYFCFEQGEELGRRKGVTAILNYLDEQCIDTVWAIHVYNKLKAGKICVDAGPRMAGVAGAMVKVIGKGGHGSRPDLSNNPVYAAANILVNLGGVFTNRIDANETVTCGITTLTGGGTPNVFSDEAILAGTFRFFNVEEGRKAVDLFKNVSEHTAAMYDCFVEFDEKTKVLGVPVITNKECSEFAKKSLPEFIGDNCITSCDKWYASESFSAYTSMYPSVFAFLGIDNEEEGSGAEHHSEFFDIDEKVLMIGVKATVGYATSFAKINKEEKIDVGS
ncbi:amidohydrolase [Anaerorhabdus sp.]|uniref:amidohydrolase n=1 Tax=Anaerorhabdus sp. TaxID=1872524 RepID=UPI002FC6F45F